MVWFFVIVVVGIIIYFLSDLNKDNHDLKDKSLSEKFNVIVNMLNQSAFRGNGQITNLDKRSFNIYEDGQNQIVNLHYSTGHLTITWKYKYFQKEIVHEKQFNDVRNLSLFEQQKIAETMINEMAVVIAKHKNSVLDVAKPKLEPPVNKKTHEFYLNTLKNKMEIELRALLKNALRDSKEYPEMMQGMMIMNAAGNFCEGMKKDYPRLKAAFEKNNEDIGVTEDGYKEIVDNITSKVLGEFIELPESNNKEEDEYWKYL